MEITPTSTRMYGFMILYDMHTDYFARAIESISDDDAHKRLGTKANHMAWITGSLLYQRYEIAKELGIDGQSAFEELFKEGKGIQGELRYPSLAAYQEEWDTISPILREAFLNVTD